MNDDKLLFKKIFLDEKKEKFIIFALSGILILIICLPVKKEKNNLETNVILKSESTDNFSDFGAKNVKSELKKEENLVKTEFNLQDTFLDDYTEATERRLTELLQCMDGVGKVKVMITLRGSREEIVEKDRPVKQETISEKDGGGGTRATGGLESGEETVFFTEEDGRRIPYIKKVLEPEIGGITVLAEGGGSAAVQKNIYEAIQALFDVDANKIKIAKMKMTK